MKLLDVKSLKMVYTTRFGGEAVCALKDINFSVENGEFVAIMGESGSGKSTLLNILASLDRPTSGEVILDGKNIVKLSDKEVTAYRRENLGFVFQDFNLLDSMSIKDNILLPIVLSKKNVNDYEEKLTSLVKSLGISELLNKFPYEVSGGEKQRCAVARALISSPKILLADEPTGALDSKQSENLLKKFTEINATGQTVLMVTHSVKAASYANRVMFIKDGIVFHQIFKGDNSHAKFFEMIQDSLTVLTKAVALND